jgi:two-component system OmpR family response regulator
MRALIVEDDKTLAEFVANGLQQAGFAVDVAGDGERGLALAVEVRPDVAIVDLGLPGLDGLSLIDALRRRGERVPVLILSARHTVDDRVTRQGKDIELRPREFALLEYLMRNAGRVVSKTMILSRIWDYSFDPRTNVVDVLVYRLREKIDHEFEPKLLQTRRGMGYVLEVPGQAGR